MSLPPMWVDGHDWHLEVRGDGPVVLALHGAGASGHSFGRLAARLPARWVIPDLPGHGRSRSPRRFVPSLPNVARAVGRLLEARQLQPDVVIGHSAGAAIAAAMTLDGAARPERLVCLAGAFRPLRGAARLLMPRGAAALTDPRLARLLAWRARRGRGVARTLARIGSPLDPEGVAAYEALAGDPRHVAGSLAMMAAWDLDPLFDTLAGIEAPTLLLAGDRDSAVPLGDQRAAASRLPRGELQVLEGAGHLLHEERPGAVAAAVSAFVHAL